MTNQLQRILLGSVTPLIIICSFVVFVFRLGRDNLEGLPETLGAIFLLGVLVLGLPLFVISCFAEFLNKKVANNGVFYTVGSLLGFVLSQVLSIVDPTLAGVLIFGSVGVIAGLSTAIIIRRHYLKYSR